MTDSTPYSSYLEVVRAAFEQLGWNMTPVNALEEQLEATRTALALTTCFNEEVGWGTCPDVDETAGICSRCAALGVSFKKTRGEA